MHTKAKLERQHKSVLGLLKDKFGEKLIFVGFFGSYAVGEAGRWSDVDYLVVAEDLPKDPITRDKFSPHMKQILKDSYPPLAFNFYTPLEIKQIAKLRPWYHLSIINTAVTIWEKKGFLQELKKQLPRGKYDQMTITLPKPSKKAKEESQLLLKRSRQALLAAELLFKSERAPKGEVLNLLQRSQNFLLSSRLVLRGVYPVKGEVTQLFLAAGGPINASLEAQIREVAFPLEQQAGRYGGLSLDFDREGKQPMDLDVYLKTSDIKMMLSKYKKLFQALDLG
jgi:predicted nucleotidyltransferase